MRRFAIKPLYTVGDLAQMWNAFEESAAARLPPSYKRTVWNRAKVRRLLQSKGLLVAEAGAQGRRRTVTLEELRRAWPELVDSMLAADDHEEAVRAA